MKVWFKRNDRTKVISFGKDEGYPDEGFFEYYGELKHDYEHEYYSLATSGAITYLVPDTDDDVIASKKAKEDKKKLIEKRPEKAKLNLDSLKTYVHMGKDKKRVKDFVKNTFVSLKDVDEQKALTDILYLLFSLVRQTNSYDDDMFENGE